MAVSTAKVRNVPDKPFQPRHLSFPPRSFGKTSPVSRSFQASWFNHFTWIHYNVGLDGAFCFTCCKAVKTGKVKPSGTAEPAFLVNGFTKWKDASRIFSKHETCNLHQSAAAAFTNQVDIGEMLSKQYATEKRANREYLLKILSSIHFLAHQGLPLRGDMDETDLNFISFGCFEGKIGMDQDSKHI